MVPALFKDLKVAEINRAGKSESQEPDRTGKPAEAPAPGLIALVRSHTQFPHPVGLGNVVIHRQRDNGFQLAPFFLTERNKPKGLQVSVDWRQHLGASQHRSGPDEEHQFDLGPLLEWTGQGKQTSGQGNDLKFSGDTLATLETNNSRGTAIKLHPGGPRGSLLLGEGAHSSEGSIRWGNHEKKVTEGLVLAGLPARLAALLAE